MERLVIFRDYQEQTADDHNNLQAYARETIDDLALDAVTAARRFAGFSVAKTGQVEVTVQPGRIYDGGGIYKRRTALTQSMSTYTAAAAKRVVAISAYGVEVETDTQARDYLVDTETGQTEPRSVDTTRSRDVQIVYTTGAESAEPVPPPLPATHVLLATVLLDTTQVLSVTMADANRVASTGGLDDRARSLETFRDQTAPRLASLSSDLASLAADLRTRSDKSAFRQVFLDLARIKETLRFPDAASDYGSDFFLDRSASDTGNASALGYDCNVEMGVRFAAANAGISEIALFSANDPNASVVNGILLPRFTDEVRITTGSFASDLGISQYGFQMHQVKTGYMSRSRLRYGGYYIQCSNGSYAEGPGQPPAAANLYDFDTTGFDAVGVISYDPVNPGHEGNRTDHWWFDTWKEPYLYTETTDATITGALVAQTFLCANDLWATRLGVYVTAKGAAEDIQIVLCEVANGVPDIDHALVKTVHPQAGISVGWNRVPIPPTFLQKGKRYGVILISNANHKIGMASGGYLDGTFFYSTDGIYYQGDLTKDMMLEVWGAKFDTPQVAVEFSPLSLDGGLRAIDILAEQWAPSSTQLVFELRPNGSGEWLPLVRDLEGILASAPPLVQFRARMVGTRDMAPALRLTGSRVKVFRPKTTMRHVSTVQTLATASTAIHVKLLLEGFDEAPHDCGCTLRIGATTETADVTTTALLDADAKRYERNFTFTLPAPTASFRIVIDGATTSPLQTFHVAERDYYAL